MRTVRKALWTSRQRQACSLHEISYRACFKAELPRYFIKQFSRPLDLVYDPFAGRGTTGIEAALLGRIPVMNDVNPLSRILAEPRMKIPDLLVLEERLHSILKRYTARGKRKHLNPLLLSSKKNATSPCELDLSMFFHADTLEEILSVREYLRNTPKNDIIDKWIRMIVTNRLTGHSSGFLSGYTLPPNQATTQEWQLKSNRARGYEPPYRNLIKVVLKKARALLKRISTEELENMTKIASQARFFCKAAHQSVAIKDETVALIVTSPPFLNIVNYASDNWLRAWFNDIDMGAIAFTMLSHLEAWERYMQEVFKELYRICIQGGHLAFEVGEIRKATVNLDESVLRIGEQAQFKPIKTYINQQHFTKTANIWGVTNNLRGTNTNRIVLFKK